MAEIEQPDVMSLTVTLLSAYFANNTVPSSELPTLVEGTRKALLGDLTAPAAAPAKTEPSRADATTVEPAAEPLAAPSGAPEQRPVPAVTIEESIASPDHLISLVDGKPYKTLKRHLATHGLTPADYRSRYDLPKDYPMTAVSYSEARRAVAKRLGLGNRSSAAQEPVAAAETPPPAAPAKAPKTAAKPAKARTTARKAASSAKSAKADISTEEGGAKAPRKPRAAKAAAEPVPEPVAVSAPAPKRRRAKANGKDAPVAS
jgi:predicted transcriptional regulator